MTIYLCQAVEAFDDVKKHAMVLVTSEKFIQSAQKVLEVIEIFEEKPEDLNYPLVEVDHLIVEKHDFAKGIDVTGLQALKKKAEAVSGMIKEKVETAVDIVQDTAEIVEDVAKVAVGAATGNVGQVLYNAQELAQDGERLIENVKELVEIESEDATEVTSEEDKPKKKRPQPQVE